jgi:hypothetical protein
MYSSVERTAATATVFVTVVGAPHTPRQYNAEQMIHPTAVLLEWSIGDRSERLSAEVSGPRVLKSGADGQQISERFWNPRDVPAWVVELAAKHRPAFLDAATEAAADGRARSEAT